MSAIPFFTLNDERRQHYSELIRTRLLSDRGRQFLQIALDAADAAPPAGFQSRYYADALIVHATQERIAELLSCSVRTVQRLLSADLSACLEQRRVPVQLPDGSRGAAVVYVILFDELALMPGADPTDAIDQLILSAGPGLADLRELRREQMKESAPADAVVCPVVSVVASPVVSVVASPVVSLMNHDHDHERMNERDFEAMESKPEPQQRPARFVEISPIHLMAIAGHAVPTRDGSEKIAPYPQRLRLFDAYFDDAVKHGRADSSERSEMLALFHCAANRSLTNRARWLFKVWENRKQPGKSLMDLLRPADRSYAREVISAVTNGDF